VGAAGVATLFSYWFFVGSHNRLFRKSLISQLNDAKLDVSELEDQLATLESEIRASKKKKEIRIFVDGAFDLFHFGHMNAFRQARALGTFLIVGVNSDESVARCKGGKWCSYTV
jgi:ethanolamine-phosphate cytidylyltransferase